ncbi:MAG TPA: serine hydrolase [Thermomicrobiales bacterium]|nr:serine hydrolase [Thermomicrobiales bacterium]
MCRAPALALLVVLLALAACTMTPGEPLPTPTPAAAGDLASPAPAVAALAASPAPPSLAATPAGPPASSPATLGRDLNALLARYTARGVARAGVVITDRQTGVDLAIGPDDVFPAASLYKLIVLWAVQREIHAGRLADDTPLELTADNDDSADDGYQLGPYGSTISVADARRLMITQSNNTAAWTLVGAVGGWAALDTLPRARGLAHTGLLPAPTTTAADVTRFFAGLMAGNLDPDLGPADYDLMLALLRAQEINTFLPTGLPPGTPFAHKTGELDDVVHDAGVLLLPGGRTIYLTVLTEGDYDACAQLMHDLAQLTWQALVASTKYEVRSTN